ncbi:MAG: class II glutamine amidotransferase [Bifidobacteriaceae bacterium]|nr:class II glutamine amidotransferase [Bifidobacteriaceae bacterium]
MCRLLGYVSTQENKSLIDVIGQTQVSAFREMSRIHNDGWGISQLGFEDKATLADSQASRSGSKLYKSTLAAYRDSNFDSFAHQAARGSLWHLRLASSQLPLIMENQQPFYSHGISFIHNGDISNHEGVNIIRQNNVWYDEKIFSSINGYTDSALYFSYILEYYGFGYSLDEAVIQAIRQLRNYCPLSSYNCVLQNDDTLIVVNAAGRVETPERIIEIYNEHGFGEHAHDYRLMRYKSDEEQGTFVVASSGFDQHDWHTMQNNEIVVVNSHTGEFSTRVF